MPKKRVTEEELNQIFEEAIWAADKLPDSHSPATKDANYMHLVLSTSYRRYSILYQRAQDETSIYPIIASGLQFVRGVAGELKELAIRLEKIILREYHLPLLPVVKWTGSFGSATDIASDLFDLQRSSKLEPIPATIPRKFPHEFYKSWFSKAIYNDPELLESYDQVWQISKGISAGRYRASLLTLRQVFDHFFWSFAPDDRVRASAFWEPKKEGESDKIFLSERIACAASTDLLSNELSDSLAGLLKLIINLYESSIMLDKQGNLDEVKASKLLLAMDNILKDWFEIKYMLYR